MMSSPWLWALAMLALSASLHALLPGSHVIARVRLHAFCGLISVTLMLLSVMPWSAAGPVGAVMLASALGTFRLARSQAVRPTRGGLGFALALALAAPLSQAALQQVDSHWAVPVGLGFFALRQLHLVLLAQRTRQATADVVEWLAYLFFLPTLIAGPLERLPSWRTLCAKGADRNDLGPALELMLLGAAKKFVVADQLLHSLLPPQTLVDGGLAGLPWTATLAACAIRVVYVYVEFSGYTDMARGAARLYGLDLMQNFDRPLLRSNLAAFWRCWHISLSGFMRDHVFYPLLVATRRPALALTATMLGISAWHGVEAGWWLWGLHHAAGLAVLAAAQRRWLGRPSFAKWRRTGAWRLLGLLCTWFYVASGSAFLWQAGDPLTGLSIYLKLWTLGASQ